MKDGEEAIRTRIDRELEEEQNFLRTIPTSTPQAAQLSVSIMIYLNRKKIFFISERGPHQKKNHLNLLYVYLYLFYTYCSQVVDEEGETRENALAFERIRRATKRPREPLNVSIMTNFKTPTL